MCITLDDFEKQVKEIETLSVDFQKLQKKYERDGRWSKAYEDEHGMTPPNVQPE